MTKNILESRECLVRTNCAVIPKTEWLPRKWAFFPVMTISWVTEDFYISFFLAIVRKKFMLSILTYSQVVMVKSAIFRGHWLDLKRKFHESYITAF